jgi:hypothetical protein
MASRAEERFMQQQGFAPEEPSCLRGHFRALLFQPSIVGPSLLVAILLQSRILFFVLEAVLAWNTLFPRWNPFERFYDWTIGRRRGLPKLEPAPAPRRFMEGMAAMLMLATGLALGVGWQSTAYVLQVFLVVAFPLLLAGKFCRGAYIYHVSHGRVGFANATCPWSKS